MGILSSGSRTKQPASTDFTQKELEFLLAKLRSATYKGDEFEMFYNVWVKINNNIDSLKK